MRSTTIVGAAQLRCSRLAWQLGGVSPSLSNASMASNDKFHARFIMGAKHGNNRPALRTVARAKRLGAVSHAGTASAGRITSGARVPPGRRASSRTKVAVMSFRFTDTEAATSGNAERTPLGANQLRRVLADSNRKMESRFCRLELSLCVFFEANH